MSFKTFRGGSSGIKESSTKQSSLQGDHVLIKISHSGVCGTDVLYKGADMVLGHEGVGHVEDVGPDVRELKKGDRVGWGYEHDCCGSCKHCLTGWETFCPERKMYGMADLDQGSFADKAVWREAFLFKVPDELDNASAAPLMCGGSTVFNALVVAGVKATDRVGIVGIGGLGHLAIQFANKMGAHVVVFSGTDSKKEEALKLGAHEFHATKDAKELKTEGDKKLTHLVVSTSSLPDWALYLPVLDNRATISPLTVSDKPFTFPYQQLVVSGLRVQGGIVGARQVHRDMLQFAAFHGVKPMVQQYPMTEKGIAQCFEDLEGGKMRYRGVLVAQ
ncbi:NAD(P)-dependent alcohol dehydrogenase [Aspergillus stella-maris]|uniref:NAD(P)-dependent alcohol dehydrogenase n=1 Tax=Aspergillus stella-maris TaxID=1810926 RepID=UPI003CCD8296